MIYVETDVNSMRREHGSIITSLLSIYKIIYCLNSLLNSLLICTPFKLSYSIQNLGIGAVACQDPSLSTGLQPTKQILE